MKDTPLYKKIVDDIRLDIQSGKLRPGDRVPSERELTQQYRVSQMTTKNALNELADKNYIIRSKGKGSFVNHIEALVESGLLEPAETEPASLHIIGLILPMMKTKIDQELFDHIELYSRQHGYHLLIKISRESQMVETEAIRELRSLGAEGIILFPTENELYTSEILMLALDQFPLVFVDRYLQGIHASSVTTDNYQITKDSILDMKRKGAKSIAFLSPDSKNSVTFDRLAGFYSAFDEDTHPHAHVYKLMIDLNVKERSQKEEIIRDFIAANPAVDGFFCVNHELAKLLMHVLEEHFPELIGNRLLYAFDASDLPCFTYIQQDTRLISKLAVETLHDLMRHKGANRHLTVPAEIQYRRGY